MLVLEVELVVAGDYTSKLRLDYEREKVASRSKKNLKAISNGG